MEEEDSSFSASLANSNAFSNSIAMEEEDSSPNSPLQFPFPPYPEMILAAIEDLNEPKGSNKKAISEHIKAAYPATDLTYNLNQMIQSGQLVVVAQNKYKKADPDAPLKRKPGLPPKPVAPVPSEQETAVASSRLRDRPPKKVHVPPTIASSGRRGRPSVGFLRPRGLPSKEEPLPPGQETTTASSRPHDRTLKLNDPSSEWDSLTDVRDERAER